MTKFETAIVNTNPPSSPLSCFKSNLAGGLGIGNWGFGFGIFVDFFLVLCLGSRVQGLRCRRNQDPGARRNPHWVERKILVRRYPPLEPADAPLVLHSAVGDLVLCLGVGGWG